MATSATPRAIGVMGGTFDPIHYGHLRLAEEMAEFLNLERVLFIPAGRPPHRSAPRTAAAHRLEMVRRAVAGNPRFLPDDREVKAARPSYTVETLTGLRNELGPAPRLWLLLGADAFFGLPDWHAWRQLFDLANVAVAARPGVDGLHPEALPQALKAEVADRRTAAAATAGPAGSVLLHQTTALDISASAIRARLAGGGSVRYLLPDAVLGYIHEHQLYGHA